jgi:hypothetical protein
VEIGERACGLADDVGDASLNALSRMELSSVCYLRGDLRRAEALLTQARPRVLRGAPDAGVA